MNSRGSQILELASSFLRSADPGDLAERIVHGLADFSGFSRVHLFLVDPRSGRVHLRADTEAEPPGRTASLQWSDEDLEQITSQSHRRSRSYIEPRPDGEWTPEHRLVVPLLGGEGLALGYLGFRGPQSGHAPDDEALRDLELLADQAAGAMASVKMRGEIEQMRREVSLSTERLRELERLKSNFVSTVSHELRTPLTSIRAYCESLMDRDDTMDPQMAHEFLGVIQGESQRLTERIDDILELARHQNTDAGPRLREPFDLHQLCERAGESVLTLASDRRIQLHYDGPSGAVPIEGDRDAIEQLLLELIENAMKFSPEGGEVFVRLSAHSGRVELIVEDSGGGIPDDEAQRIFDRFYQVDASTTRVHGGQGLGLAICRAIVRDHEGQIWVERAESGGSRFHVVFPRRLSVMQPSPRADLDAGVRSDLLDFLDLAVVLVSELMGTEITSIMLSEPSGETLRIEAAVGLDRDVVRHTRVPSGTGVAGQVFANGDTVLIPDVRQDERFAGRVNDQQYSNHSLLSCPMLLDGRVLGVLNVNNKTDGAVFGEDDRLLLEALASRIARAFGAFEAFREGHRRLAGARNALRASLELTRDRRTPLREAVARCGLTTARLMGFAENELRALSYALRIYDLGLTAVDAQILRKLSPLSTEERHRIHQHSRLGAELGEALEPSTEVQAILVHHHENVDGSGYPDGLEGDNIPVGARVVRLVDAFTAMLHGRPSRPALSLQEAIDLTHEAVGRRFCPDVSKVFLELIESNRNELERIAETQRTLAIPHPLPGSREDLCGAGVGPQEER